MFSEKQFALCLKQTYFFTFICQATQFCFFIILHKKSPSANLIAKEEDSLSHLLLTPAVSSKHVYKC
jgi:hypothetical protein